MKITFIQTGGTIDKIYPQAMGQYSFEISESAFKDILGDANPNFTFEFLSVIKKDSTEITDDDREKLLRVCRDCKNDKIIVTHGTDTMVQTAKVLSQLTDKTIILTGSMRPAIFKNSDAAFNLGVAVGAMNCISASNGGGCFIAMNGRVYPYDKVVKDPSSVKFMDA